MINLARVQVLLTTGVLRWTAAQYRYFTMHTGCPKIDFQNAAEAKKSLTNFAHGHDLGALDPAWS